MKSNAINADNNVNNTDNKANKNVNIDVGNNAINTKSLQAKVSKKTFGHFAKRYSPLLVLSVLLSAISVTSMLLSTLFSADAIDHMIGKNDVDFSAVAHYCILLLIFIPVAGLCQYLAQLLAHVYANKITNQIRKTAFLSVSRIPLNKLDGISHGDLVMRVTTDAQRLSEGLTQALSPLAPGIITIIGTLVLMFSKNVSIAWFVAGFTPLSILASYFIVKNGQKMLSRQVKNEVELSALSEEYMSNIRFIKLNDCRSAIDKKFDETNAQIKKYGAKAVFISAIVNPGTRLINGIIYTGVCLIGAIMIINGSPLTVGGLSIFLGCAFAYAKPFNEITGVVTELQSAVVSAKRLLSTVNGEREADESDLDELKITDAPLTFKDVAFRYDENPFIENFNLDIKSGQKVAVVGTTGSGKTTLLSLIMRFYEIDEGAIEIGGVDTKSISRNSLRSNIGMVLQDAWLFKGTAKANIGYADDSATDEQIINASKQAGIHSYIERLENGYDTIIDPQSVSQGQSQLFSLARIFLTLPKIIILDEATSNIDARTEAKIQRALAELTQNHTCFIVAHRLNTIKESDVILVMEHGRIAERGTHAELLSLNGIYANMLNS